MKKLTILSTFLFALLVVFSSFNIDSTYAYFNSLGCSRNVSIAIGSWRKNLIDISPDGTIILNTWIDEDTLNQTIPYTQYFIYNNQLYQVTNTGGYNPSWHGIPYDGSGVEGWAFISLSLNWAGATQRYKVGTVVRINDRFFQAMHLGNTCDPRSNHGPTKPYNSGEPWREIEPMEDYMFAMIPNSLLIDYSSPISTFVIEKY